MNTYSKKTDNFFINENNRTDRHSSFNQDGINMLYVSGDSHNQNSILNTLKYFSFNGMKLNILNAASCEEAKMVCNENSKIVLIIVDKIKEQINGSGIEFSKHIKNNYENINCRVVFKDELMSSSPTIEVSGNSQQEYESDFEFARNRLIDFIRMVMLTNDMESRLNGKHAIDYNKDTGENDETEASLNITKDKLYTILAHDLKGPIHNIKVLLDFLTNEPELLDKKTSKELLLNVRESANSVQDLLEDFLFWTRMHKHEINYNPVRVNLSNLIRESTTLLRSSALNKNISIISDISENNLVYADEYMISTVLRNLLYNAIKFTKKRGNISISSEDQAGYIKVNVKDNGVGISEQDLKKLFRTDVHFSTKGTALEAGTGLGLVLCKDFIEKNGGLIKVESEKGLGSKFSFTIPKWKNHSAN